MLMENHCKMVNIKISSFNFIGGNREQCYQTFYNYICSHGYLLEEFLIVIMVNIYFGDTCIEKHLVILC